MKSLLLSLLLLAGTAFAGDRQLINPDQDGDLKIRVNKGGTVTDAVSVTGATGSVTLGPLNSTQTHTVNGPLAIKPSSSAYTMTIGSASGDTAKIESSSASTTAISFTNAGAGTFNVLAEGSMFQNGSQPVVSIVATGSVTVNVVTATGAPNTCAAPNGPGSSLGYVKYSNGLMHMYGKFWWSTNQNSACITASEVTLTPAFSGDFYPAATGATMNNSVAGPSGYALCAVAGSRGAIPSDGTLRLVAAPQGTWTSGNIQRNECYLSIWGAY
jgi:hypothetical protein